MRKFKCFVLAILLVSFHGLTAQITITSASMPAANDTIRYSTASPSGIGTSWKTKGGNQTWDFSTLTSTGQALNEYKSANKTPYAFYFFGQIGQKTADSLGGGPFLFKNIYSFYSKSSTVFKAEGLGYTISGIPLASMYSDEDEIYQFPLQYNDSDVSKFRFVFSIPGQTLFTFIQAGKRTNLVDAWGSIKTPYKTYTDAIRVFTIVDEVDTLATQFSKTPIPRKTVSYKWLATSEKIPVLEIIGTLSANGTFTPTIINYRDKYIANTNTNGMVADFTIDKDTGTVLLDTFTLTNTTTPFSFTNNWSITPSMGVKFVNGTSATSQNIRLVFSNGGLYSVKLKASAGILTDDTSYNDLIFIGWGLNRHEIHKVVNFYPNPTKDFIILEGQTSAKNATIFNSQGQAVKIGLVEDGKIDVRDLSSGIYYLKVESGVIQFIKQD